MNTTANALLTFYHTASSALSSTVSRFSYVQVPHIKLKAEHQALVLFHIVKICLAYWEGWRDGKRNGNEGKGNSKRKRASEKEEGRRKKNSKERGRKSKVVGQRKYTVVFQ
jgi:hypothetical protein